jgi:hypothetical protein
MFKGVLRLGDAVTLDSSSLKKEKRRGRKELWKTLRHSVTASPARESSTSEHGAVG